MSDTKYTSGPWESSHHRPLKTIHNPNNWEVVKHQFPNYPYEGELEQEHGIYPQLGESGPVALVSGEANARLIVAAPEMLDCLKELVDILDNSPREIDSFTAQPAKNIIAKIESEERA